MFCALQTALRKVRLSNIVHNMDDHMKLPPYVLRRGKVLQYVRRIPGDIAHAFPVVRIQRTLATTNVSEAYAAAGRITTELEAQFAGIRREKGFTVGVIHVELDLAGLGAIGRLVQSYVDRR